MFRIWKSARYARERGFTGRGIFGLLLARASEEGGHTVMRKPIQVFLTVLLMCLAAGVASAQNGTTQQGAGSFMVQCPDTTPFHPTYVPSGTLGPNGTVEPNYVGPVALTPTLGGVAFSGADHEHPAYISNAGVIKCQEISGGDGYMTEADGNQTFMFAFGPLSGLDNIKNGLPGTLLNSDFNGDIADTSAIGHHHGYYNNPNLPSVCNPVSMPASCTKSGSAVIASTGTDPVYDPNRVINTNAGIADPAEIMTIGVMNGNIPAPLIAFDEDDEFFLTLSNVGMIMRPDLFEEHTVHFHGYPNASSYYDGVPDATWAINIGGSATYYYLAPDAGTYFWHCHITPPEHLQMGMVGQLYVRPRQNHTPPGNTAYSTDLLMQKDLRTACTGTGPTASGPVDILCSAPLPAANTFTHQAGYKYAYDDGDGSTLYDIDVPIQMHGFDPNFHFVGMTFNPEGFADMKDKYFLLNGRSYPDTVGIPGYVGGPSASAAQANGNPDVTTNAIGTEDSDGRTRYSQPMPTLVTLDSHKGAKGSGERALLRIADLSVTEYSTLASMGIPMLEVGFNAKILRDQAGNNMYLKTNSINLGGGESLDVIIDSCAVRTGPETCTATIPPGTYFLYTPILDHLSNDAENFGGLMTEVVVK
jgi:FtsP/CotA-like multicopper oxidase with cupredoxin domain